MENHQPKGVFAAPEHQELTGDALAVAQGIQAARLGGHDQDGVAARRIANAAVTTLGQIATVVAAEANHDPAADDDDQADVYPWADAARWYAAGGPDDFGHTEAAGMDSELVDDLFARLPDEQFGFAEEMGWCGLLRHEGRPGGVILRQNQYGRRSAWVTDSVDELARHWDEAKQEYAAFRTATSARTGNGEAGGSAGPEIWVGSLSDYNAGILHGAWLDATLDADELGDAVQFMLKNSHEPDAEEYGVFDYDDFGYGLSSLLGEYPSLTTVSKIAQGIEEHGEAFAAWAAYVGPEQAEQLDRFEDHYLGEWDSMEAYAENLLEECEAYRYVDEAPEWLRPYLSLDVEGYARDLGFDLHVEEKPGGGVWVFDAR